MRDRLTIYEQNVTLIVKPNKKNGENKMLESLKKKTLLGNLWCIIVLGIVTATRGVLFGSGIVTMLAGPAYFEPLDDHEDIPVSYTHLPAARRRGAHCAKLRAGTSVRYPAEAPGARQRAAGRMPGRSTALSLIHIS